MLPGAGKPLSAYVVLLYGAVVAAVPWQEAVETPAGFMAHAGFSPKPTPAPGFRAMSIPKELLRREEIPLNWCGFIGGDTGRVLSCPASTRCVYFGSAVGCCGDGAIATCADLYTSCVDTASNCDSACNADTKILKCPGVQQRSYCATYAFSRDYTKYGCITSTSLYTSVDLIKDYYATVSFGSLLESGVSNIAITNPTGTAGGRATRTSSSSSSSATGATGTKSSSGFSPRTGIVIGAVATVLVLGFALLIGCCIWHRRRRRRQQQMLNGGKPNGSGSSSSGGASPNQPLMQHPAPPGVSMQPAVELHNTSSAHLPPAGGNPYMGPPGALFPVAPPPQYSARPTGATTSTSTSGGNAAGIGVAVSGGGNGSYYAEPKIPASEVDGTPYHGREPPASPVSGSVSPAPPSPHHPSHHYPRPPPPPLPARRPYPVYEMGPGPGAR